MDSATEVLPQPAGPVMTQMCCCSGGDRTVCCAEVACAVAMSEWSSFVVDTGEANSLGGVGGRVVVVDMAAWSVNVLKEAFFSWPSRVFFISVLLP